MRKLGIVLFIVCLGHWALAQSDLAFYHLGDRTPQSMINNASFFPDAEFYFTLPGLSGLNIKTNNGFTYNQLMVPVEGTDSVKVDLDRALDHLKERDNFRIKGDVPLFQFGIRSGNKTFSLFYNVRFSGGMVYPVRFLNYFVHGNGNYIGQQVEEKTIRGGGVAYTEMGFGYSQELVAFGDRQLRIGARVKLLNGIAHVSAASDASMTMYTDPETYDLNVRFNNATFRTVGLNELQGDSPVPYLIGFGANGNNGFAVDLGGQIEINEKLTGFLSLNDLGFIKWKQDIENYSLIESEITLTGFDNIDDVDVAQALEDSLDVWSEHETTSETFRTPIGARYIIGANYQVLENGVVSGTIVRNGSSYGASEIGFGVGYTHQFGKILTLSTTVSKEQSRPVQLGGGLVLRLGVIQMYGAFDNLLNIGRDPADITGMSAQFGMNFLIGRKKIVEKAERIPKQKEELSPFPPEYDLDHLLNSEDDSDQ